MMQNCGVNMIESSSREGRELKRKKKAAPPGGKEGKRQKVNLGGNQGCNSIDILLVLDIVKSYFNF